MEIIAALLVFATALFCVVSYGSLTPSLAGLAISNALSIGTLMTVSPKSA